MNHHKELSLHELSILAKKRLARSTRQMIVLEDKFRGMDDDPIIKETKIAFGQTLHNAVTYLSDYLHQPEEAERIKRVVKDRYMRRSRAT